MHEVHLPRPHCFFPREAHFRLFRFLLVLPPAQRLAACAPPGAHLACAPLGAHLDCAPLGAHFLPLAATEATSRRTATATRQACRLPCPLDPLHGLQAA